MMVEMATKSMHAPPLSTNAMNLLLRVVKGIATKFTFVCTTSRRFLSKDIFALLEHLLDSVQHYPTTSL